MALTAIAAPASCRCLNPGVGAAAPEQVGATSQAAVHWQGTAELLDPNGIVIAEVAAELVSGRGGRRSFDRVMTVTRSAIFRAYNAHDEGGALCDSTQRWYAQAWSASWPC